MKRMFFFLSGWLAACGDSRAKVNVYVSLDDMFSRPIFDRFESKTGIRVRNVVDPEVSKTVGLYNKILLLRDRPEADIWWNNEMLHAILLQRKGLLEPFPLPADIPAEFRDPGGHWFGIAARARVILYNTKKVRPDEAPRSIYDFTKPAWKGRFAIAKPVAGSTLTHVACLYATLGPEEAEKLLRAWKENGAKVAQGNAMARDMVASGETDACLTDTDDANGAFLRGAPVEMVYPDRDGIGTLVFPNTIMLIRGGPNPEAAKRLIEFLSSPEVEAELARSPSAQLPVRKGVPPYSDRFDPAGIKAMRVDLNKAADMMDRALAFCEKVFVQ